MRRSCVFCVVFALALAGCLSGPPGPSPQERPVFVNFSNSAETPRTIELWVAEDPLAGITVHRTTGGDYTTRTTSAGISTTNVSTYHVVSSMTFPENATLYGRYTLSSGATRTFTMAEPYARTVFVVVVYDADHVTVWKSVTCDGVLYGFKVEGTGYGALGAYTCL